MGPVPDTGPIGRDLDTGPGTKPGHGTGTRDLDTDGDTGPGHGTGHEAGTGTMNGLPQRYDRPWPDVWGV